MPGRRVRRPRHERRVSSPTRARRRPGNTTFLRADAFDTGLPANSSFDLAHMRFLASTCAFNPERLLHEAIRVVRPGGTVALQEADVSTV